MGYGRPGGQFGNGAGPSGFEPKPGSGTLFIKNDKRSAQAPDYDGYFIFDRDVRAGEKVKLVGWDKQGRTGNMITLKVGKDRQDAPGYNQGGYLQSAPQNNGYQQPPPQGRYQAPPQGQLGSYQGGGYGGQPAQSYQPPQGGYAPPAGAPPPEDRLPF